jgi:hypothetical protein
MTRFLGMLVILCVLVAGVGYWRGWFHAESHDDGGQRSMTVTVDQNKIDQDKAAAQQDIGQK